MLIAKRMQTGSGFFDSHIVPLGKIRRRVPPFPRPGTNSAWKPRPWRSGIAYPTTVCLFAGEDSTKTLGEQGLSAECSARFW
jgi:hypothetical protein